MALLQPDLERPFRDVTERAAGKILLSRRDSLLIAVEALARVPADEWSPEEEAAFPQTINGVPDSAPARLSRWANIFAEELAEVHNLAAREPLGDAELRRAVYFAGRLLSTVTDLPIDMVDGFDIPRRSAR